MAHIAHKSLCEGNLKTIEELAKNEDHESMLFLAYFLAVIKNARLETIEKAIMSKYNDVSETAIRFSKGQEQITPVVAERWMDSGNSSLRRAAVMAMSGWDVVPEDLKYRAIENEYESVRILALAEL